VTENTVLYTLSTLAQTCAALAAFVGAGGLFKLQSQRDQHVRNEQTLRGLYATATLDPQAAARLTLEQILFSIRASATGPMPTHPAEITKREDMRKALGEWDGFLGRQGRATKALFVFEGWHLFVIGAALIGFNHVERLQTWPGTPSALWIVAAGTVGVTIWSMLAWTRE
jgi:hypothetical protein